MPPLLLLLLLLVLLPPLLLKPLQRIAAAAHSHPRSHVYCSTPMLQLLPQQLHHFRCTYSWHSSTHSRVRKRTESRLKRKRKGFVLVLLVLLLLLLLWLRLLLLLLPSADVPQVAAASCQGAPCTPGYLSCHLPS